MQNVVNYIVPFFGADGKPIANGRVHFCKVGTSANTFNDISSPDYIHIYNKDGIELLNPLPLNELGQFSVQPFVKEETDFKMIVDADTGLPAVLQYGENDDTPCWRTELVIDSRCQKVSVDFAGVASVGNIAELRNCDPSVGSVLVGGYYSPGDFCPPRLFSFTLEDYEENYGTHIKSLVNPNGCWVCEPYMSVADVRWFGYNPKSNSINNVDEVLENIKKSYNSAYFPEGNYYVSSFTSIRHLVLERGATIYPNKPKGAYSVAFDVELLENRGGQFVDWVGDVHLFHDIGTEIKAGEISVESVVFSNKLKFSGEKIYYDGLKVVDFSNGAFQTYSLTTNSVTSSFVQAVDLKLTDGDTSLKLTGEIKEWSNGENETYDLVANFPNAQAGDVVNLRVINANTDSPAYYSKVLIEKAASGNKFTQIYGASLLQFYCKYRSGSNPVFIPMFNGNTTKG